MVTAIHFALLSGCHSTLLLKPTRKLYYCQPSTVNRKPFLFHFQRSQAVEGGGEFELAKQGVMPYWIRTDDIQTYFLQILQNAIQNFAQRPLAIHVTLGKIQGIAELPDEIDGAGNPAGPPRGSWSDKYLAGILLTEGKGPITI